MHFCLRMKGRSTFYFSLKQTQGTFAGAHGLYRDAEKRLSSLVLTPTSQFKTKTPLNLYEITICSRMCTTTFLLLDCTYE